MNDVTSEAALGADAKAFSTGEAAEDGDDVDIDEESSVDAEKALEVNSAIAVEKEIAADSLGIIFSSVGEDFLPYIEPSTQELVTLLDHYYEGIRKSAVSSLFEFLKTFYELSKPEPWQPGVPVVSIIYSRNTLMFTNNSGYSLCLSTIRSKSLLQ